MEMQSDSLQNRM